MTTISTDDPIAQATVAAIHTGDLTTLRRLLTEHPWLAIVRLGSDEPGGMSRTLLRVATDWPGHYPHVAASVGALVDAGADVNARFAGPQRCRTELGQDASRTLPLGSETAAARGPGCRWGSTSTPRSAAARDVHRATGPRLEA